LVVGDLYLSIMRSIHEYRVERSVIEKQVQKILSSKPFRDLELFSLFLRYVVEETLAGHSHRLEEQAIAINILTHSGVFNSRYAFVQIHAARVRRLLAEYYQSEGLLDNVLITIPEGSYVPHFQIKSPVI
jgi:adenylate cyclase